ncbi:TPA: hypothetical protein VEO38_003533 [Providencia alcalifaciens]|nr:hypothetical protein [Providencia alcalifaciens]
MVAKKLSTLANAQGVWRIALGEALPDGETSYQVTAVDAAGNEKTEASTVTVKTSSPNFTLQLDGQTDFKTRNTQPVFSGKTEAEAEVLVIIDNKHYPTKADAQGNWSLSVTHSLADGTHLLSVQVTDVVGNLSSSTHNLWVDTVAPSSEARLAAEHDSGLVGDNLTNKQDISLVGMTKPQATVQVTFDGENFSTIADNDGQWRVALPKIMQDGDYSYQVNIVDSLGNQAQSNGQFTLDTTIELTAELDGASQSQTLPDEQATHSPRPQLSGSADPHSKIVAEFKGTTKTAYADEQGKWSFVFDVDADVGEDNHYLVSAEDMAGNYKQLKQSFSYFPNSTSAEANVIPPTVTVELSKNSDSGKKGDGITQVTKPIFEGTATKGAKIQFEIAGKTYDTMADRKTGLWQIETDSLDEGNNTYFVTATRLDNGLKTQVQGHVFVDTHTPSSTVELTPETDSGTKGNFITNHRNPVFTGQGEANSEVTLVVAQQTLSTTTDKNGQWSIKLDKTLPENFMGNFRVSIKDAADNTFERKGTLVIDNSKPELSEIKMTSPWKEGRFHKDQSTNDLTPDFAGKASVGAKLVFSFTMNDQSSPVKFSYPITDIDQNGNWTFSIPKGVLVKDRRYSINDIFVKAVSPAGNESTKHFYKPGIQVKESELTVKGEVAAESSMTGKNDQYLSASRSPKLQGTIDGSSDRDELRGYIEISGQRYHLSFANSRKNWSVALPADAQLPLGENNYTLTFNDVYGSEHKFSSFIVVSDFKFWLDPDTDTGRLGDQLTHHQQPAYKGKVEVGTQLSAKVNGAHHSIDVNDKGEWRFDVPINGDGTYDIEFILENNGLIAGKTSLTIDSTPPTFTDSGIVEADCHLGTQVAKNNHFNTMLTYEDEVDFVLVEVNGQQFKQTKIVTPFDGKTMQLGGEIHLPNGEHVAKITAFDLAGNKFEHQAIFKVLSGEQGEQPPHIEVGIHEKRQISAQGGKLPFNTNTLSLIGKTSPASQIEIKDAQGNVLGTTKANNAGAWSLLLPDDMIPMGIQQDESVRLFITANDLLQRKTHFYFDLVYDNLPPEITGELDGGISIDKQQVNTHTPSFSGKTDPFALVDLTLDGKKHQVTADAQGQWHIVIPETHPLKDGIYDYNIIAKDILGLVSTQPVQGQMRVKTTPEFTGGLDSHMDSGVLGDHITSQKTPIFSGYSEPNAFLRIVFDNQVKDTYEIQADQQGYWRVFISAELAEGTHDYVITIKDALQEIEGKVTGQLTIDTLAPDILTGGVMNELGVMTQEPFLTNSSRPTFKGTSEPLSFITLNISEFQYKGISVDEQGNWEFTIPEVMPLYDGEHDYQITVEDAAGNQSPKQVGKITIDTQAPDVIAQLTPDSDSGVPEDQLTNINTPSFIGLTEPHALVSLDINQVTYKTEANEQGEWLIEVMQPLADATYDYQISVEDAAGNQSPKQAGKITIDTQAPDVIAQLTPDSDSGVPEDQLTNINTPSFIGLTEPHALVSLDINQVTYKTEANEQGEWLIEVMQPLADATYDYQISVEDAAGNQSPKQAGKITIDTQAPQFISTEIQAVANIHSNKESLIFKGVAEPDAKVVVTLDNQRHDSVSVGKNGEWEFKIERTTQYEDIQYSIEIEDLAGNKSFSEGVISEEAPVLPKDGNTSMIIELQAPDFTISPAIDDIHF